MQPNPVRLNCSVSSEAIIQLNHPNSSQWTLRYGDLSILLGIFRYFYIFFHYAFVAIICYTAMFHFDFSKVSITSSCSFDTVLFPGDPLGCSLSMLSGYHVRQLWKIQFFM